MYYSETYGLLWHDTDAAGILRPSSLLRYMQETGNRQCRAYGYDLDKVFREEGRGFLLARLQLTSYAPLHAYEQIEVRTWCPPSRGYTFSRWFQVLREGETVAEALTSWALMDARAHALLKVTDVTWEFPAGDMPDTAALPSKVRLSPALPMQEVGVRQVAWSDTDFNRHMNNTRYPDVVWDHLPTEAVEGHALSTLSLSYMKEAPLGETLRLYRTVSPNRDDTYLIKALRENGEICFEAEATLS